MERYDWSVGQYLQSNEALTMLIWLSEVYYQCERAYFRKKNFEISK